MCLSVSLVFHLSGLVVWLWELTRVDDGFHGCNYNLWKAEGGRGYSNTILIIWKPDAIRVHLQVLLILCDL